MAIRPLFAVLSLLFACLPLYAGVATDGSVGARQNIVGPDYLIPESLGRRAGDNLFHSFNTFSIHKGESATFTGSQDIRNVISRVTGDAPTTIDGLLRSRIGTADFYFLNPRGVLFGANARIDVPAGFHAGTAAEIVFADGSVYSAALAAASTLTVAAPAGFGFREANPGNITIDSSELTFAQAGGVTLAGGNIILKNASLTAQEAELRIVAQGNGTGPVSFSGASSTGADGMLTATASNIYAGGAAGGKIHVRAGAASFEGSRIWAYNTGAKNNVVAIDVEVGGLLELLAGAEISTSAFGLGDAGNVSMAAGSMRIDGRGGNAFTGIASQSELFGASGSVHVHVDGHLEMINGARINSDSNGFGDAGAVVVSAASLRMDGKDNPFVLTAISSESSLFSGKSGTVTIHVDGLLELLDGAKISSSTFGPGDAGGVTVAAGEMRIAGKASWIASEAEKLAGGNAGTVTVTVDGLLSMVNGAVISSTTFSRGNAGGVTITAGSMELDGQGDSSFTGIASTAEPSSGGNAGTVTVAVDGLLSIVNGALINTSTFSRGNAGGVAIIAGSMELDAQGSPDFTGIVSSAEPGSSGNAGTVTVAVDGQLSMVNGAVVSSSTWSRGNAGGVSVAAGSLRIDGQGGPDFTGILSAAEPGSSGKAGTVAVAVDGLLSIANGALISSSTYAGGDAGGVSVAAGSLEIDRQGSDNFTGITSTAEPGSGGNAGTVTVTVDGLFSILGGAMVSSSTWSAGDAGSVSVTAGSLRIDGRDSFSYYTGITSQATPDSSGQAGSIFISAPEIELLNGGIISLATWPLVSQAGLAGLQTPRLGIVTNRLTLSGDSRISAESHGNIAAGAIDIQVGDLLLVEGSRITTEAYAGDGGPISIAGAGTIMLRNGRVTTSTLGGNGGDISLRPEALVLDTGFIQANTALGANGGDIVVAAGTFVVPEGQSLIQGGQERQQFRAGSGINVIQAAAPEGVSGEVKVPDLSLNCNSGLAQVDTAFKDFAGLGKDPCHVGRGEIPSSLVLTGRGDLPEDQASLWFGLELPPFAASGVSGNQAAVPCAPRSPSAPIPASGSVRLTRP